MASLQGSLRDEGATVERLRGFRVRRSTRDLGFRLAVVLDWSEQTRCTSSDTVRFAIGVARLFWICLSEEWRCLLDLRLGLLRDWGNGA
ncbi:uncharacterized protein HKW66_Vig0156380 [Vigna angularis]|uniref:Uncharacterized protein n=1 Tax=Phaseolus angularis TaxID=3914 RepID=A0A8T0JJV8_PHAAN|nr:uncharacterized protein HKW66_Vig0156380 [Vigna angularis]